MELGGLELAPDSEEIEMALKKLVLVGVDGSPTSNAALGWVLDVAARTGADLEVLQAWQWDVASLGVVVPDAPVEVAVATEHAPCPVVVVPSADRGTGG